MKQAYCLELEGDAYAMGDLNLFLDNEGQIEYPPADPLHPETPCFTGLIRQEVTVNGQTRPYLVYVPQHFPISGAGVFLYPDSGVPSEAFLENSAWKAAAEEQNTALIVLQSQDGGWDRAGIQREICYSEAVFKDAISRKYFSLNEATYYAMGFGAGAYTATAFALLNAALFAALAVDGDYHLHEDLLAQLGKIRSDRDAGCSKLDVALPCWLIDREGEQGGAVLDCVKRACGTVDSGLRNGFAAVHQQDCRRYQGSLDRLPMAEVWFTGKSSRPALLQAGVERQMLAFALRFKRWLGIGNGDLRPARTHREMGLKAYGAEINGRRRDWFVYEPTAYRRQPKQKRPLVLAIHGYSCTGPLFAENSLWHEVGERRDFFVVYVSALPSNRFSGGRTVPLPAWNTPAMPAETDDIGFIRQVLRDVQARYPVDAERIYVSGHSNGALLTQQLMEECPRDFAAFAPQGAQYHLDLRGDPSIALRRIPADGVVRPVWLMMGQEDIGDRDSLAPGTANDRFLDMMCAVNGLDRSAGQYRENGKYRTYTFADAAQVPLLRFTGVQDLPHTYTPEMAQLFWDMFFCHFRRKADGTVVYTQ